MKQFLTNMILAFGSAFACAAGLHAQSYTIVANVPFAFEAGGTMHEAGRYMVERPPSTPALMLRNTRQARRTVIGLAPSAPDYSKGPARLSFHRYGNQSFLAEVWNVEHTGTKIYPSAQEKEIGRSAQGAEMAVVTIIATRVPGL